MVDGCFCSETDGIDGLGSKLLISFNSGGLLISNTAGGTIVVGFNGTAVVSGGEVVDVGDAVVDMVGVVFQAGTISNNPSSLSNAKVPSFRLI